MFVEQCRKPGAQLFEQMPPMHAAVEFGPFGHTVLHEPQWFTSPVSGSSQPFAGSPSQSP
jgi:hypothetical protein